MYMCVCEKKERERADRFYFISLIFCLFWLNYRRTLIPPEDQIRHICNSSVCTHKFFLPKLYLLFVELLYLLLFSTLFQAISEVVLTNAHVGKKQVFFSFFVGSSFSFEG